MRHYKTGSGCGWHEEQGGDALRVIDGDGLGLRRPGCHNSVLQLITPASL
jgi:hypothetical protein